VSRFDTIPECDRHTDTTTAYTALSIASRGKNETDRRTDGRVATSLYASYRMVGRHNSALNMDVYKLKRRG